MGWASGSHLLDKIAYAVLPLIPDNHREWTAGTLIELFENEDCDTIGECDNPVIAKVYRKMYPDDDENLEPC
jgi:hypothetical protein